MNSTIFTKALMFFILFSATIYSQNIKNEDELSISDQDKFIALSQISSATPQLNTLEGLNTVFIQQIGNNNNVLSSIIAESSSINIIQNGNENQIEINETAREIQKTITQLGDNNTVVDFSFNPDISTNLELIQEGNNLNFERFGNNDLSKSLKFKMAGDARTIIVRSF